MRSIRFQPDWFPNGQFAGFFLAAENGYYEEYGFSVDFAGFGFGVDFVEEVVSKRAHFGTIESYIFLDRVAKGEPLVAIGAVLATSPAGYIYLKSSGIEEFADLKGRLLGVHNYAEGLVQLFEKEAGLTFGAVNLKKVEHDLSILLDGQVDAHQGFAIDEMLSLQKKTEEAVDILLFEELGLPMYSMVIYTSRETLAEEPEIVEGFLEATAKGWSKAIDQPEKAAVVISEKHPHPEVKDTILAEQIKMIGDFINLDAANPKMRTELERWESMQKAFIQSGLLAEPVDLNTCVLNERD
ncbi:MAG: ABC transporter substrate-binding protein [Verrucomicrobiota bacterium]